MRYLRLALFTYYWAKLYQGQLQKGQRYKALSRTITVNVLNFAFLPDEGKYHSMFSLYESQTGYRLNKDLEIHFLELSKWKALSIPPKTRLDKWLDMGMPIADMAKAIGLAEDDIRKLQSH